MSEEKVRAEERQTTGDEINQLLNQQFLITTAAITLFGVRGDYYTEGLRTCDGGI